MYDPTEAFCAIYRELDEAVLVARGAAWFRDSGFHDAVIVVRDAILAGRDPDAFVETAESVDGQRERVIALRGIDQAFAQLNPYHRAGAAPHSLARYQARYDLDGRFNDDPAEGLLVPKLAWSAQRDDQPLTLTELTQSLSYAPPEVLPRIEPHVAPKRCGMSREARRLGVTVACAPASADFGDLDMTIGRGSDYDTYKGSMGDAAGVRDRYVRILAAALAGDADAVVLPELMCSESLLDFWRDQLRALAPRRALRWMFTGTGDIRDGGTGPVNAGALLDGVTGETIAVQRKQFPFDITPEQQARDYPLPFARGRPLREAIEPGYGCAVVELGAARVAILICEDLTRIAPLMPALNTIGVSHILAPVFSTPTMPFRWEQGAGGDWAKANGATTIVANSLVLGRLSGSRAQLHVALVSSPWKYAAQRAAAPEDVVRFRLRHGERPEGLDDPDGNRPVAP
jgi:predicted amidohydrolase